MGIEVVSHSTRYRVVILPRCVLVQYNKVKLRQEKCCSFRICLWDALLRQNIKDNIRRIGNDKH